MARIRVPTPFNQLLQEVDPKLFRQLLLKYEAIDIEGRYLRERPDFAKRLERKHSIQIGTAMA